MSDDDFTEPRGEIDFDQFDDIELEQFLDERDSLPRPNNPIEEGIEVVQDTPFEMNIVRRASTWSETICRRLPWSRISPQKQRAIEIELLPPWTIADDDDLEEEIPSYSDPEPPAATRPRPPAPPTVPARNLTFWRNLGPREREQMVSKPQTLFPSLGFDWCYVLEMCPSRSVIVAYNDAKLVPDARLRTLLAMAKMYTRSEWSISPKLAHFLTASLRFLWR